MATILIGGDQVGAGAFAEDLREAGYKARIVPTSHEVLEAIRHCSPDVVVLCDGLAEPDSFGVCAAVRQEEAVPMIIVSSRDDEMDRVIGLELGADEYLPSPISGREMVARVRSLLRRIRLVEEGLAKSRGDLLRAGDMVVDLRQHVASIGGRPLVLTPREYDLLAFLAEHQGTAHSREELIQNVWRVQQPLGLRTVDIHVRGLREKIEVDPARPARLQTVRRVGYRLVAASAGR